MNIYIGMQAETENVISDLHIKYRRNVIWVAKLISERQPNFKILIYYNMSYTSNMYKTYTHFVLFMLMLFMYYIHR